MKRASGILTVLMIIFVILNWAMQNNRGFRLRVQSWFQDDIQLLGHGDYGNIYKTGVKHVPEDSLIEYSWDSHLMLRGHIRPLGRGPQQIRADFDGYFRDKTKVSFLMTVKSDSIYCYLCLIDGRFPETVFINYTSRDALYIYGQNYEFADAIDVAVSLLIVGEVEYEISDYPLTNVAFLEE
jgi:hypothetical protein